MKEDNGIMQYADYLKKTKEYGKLEQIKYPICFLSGLPSASLDELVIFESGQLGQIINLDRDLVEVLLFSHSPKTGSKAAATGEHLSIGVGEMLLGAVINPTGANLYTNQPVLRFKQTAAIFKSPKGLEERVKIKRPLLTGVVVVDNLLPLGKGQRELLVGDRKSGKSAFALSVAKTQANSGSVVVLAAIGKKRSEVKKIADFIKSAGIEKRCVVVASLANDSPGLVHLTPFSAMAIAEYFCHDLGQDVLLILDDLSTHAKFYREIALSGGKFPGRESYPGDMFYTHARLLERAGNFNFANGKESSITVLPVAESLEGDLTSFIVSNLISITDGHILFSNMLLNSGRKPAVDVFLSVTRVGKQTRSNFERQLTTEIIAFMSRYEKIEELSHFGAELSGETKVALDTGKKMLSLFNQSYKTTLDVAVGQVMVFMVWQNLFLQKEEEQILAFRENMEKAYKDNKKVRQMIDEIVLSSDLKTGMENLSKYKEELIKNG